MENRQNLKTENYLKCPKQISNSLRNLYYNMRTRCYNKKSDHYKFYGERGITVCNEWLNDKFVFYNWAINNGYNENNQIDRINVDGNYEPNNCRFITNKENSRNRTSNKCDYEKVEIARLFLSSGLNNKITGELLGLSQRTISHIKNGTQWT